MCIPWPLLLSRLHSRDVLLLPPCTPTPTRHVDLVHRCPVRSCIRAVATSATRPLNCAPLWLPLPQAVPREPRTRIVPFAHAAPTPFAPPPALYAPAWRCPPRTHTWPTRLVGPVSASQSASTSRAGGAGASSSPAPAERPRREYKVEVFY